jgi:hypothetical protein
MLNMLSTKVLQFCNILIDKDMDESEENIIRIKGSYNVVIFIEEAVMQLEDKDQDDDDPSEEGKDLDKEKLDRNKISAKKSRLKKKNYVQSLEDKVFNVYSYVLGQRFKGGSQASAYSY